MESMAYTEAVTRVKREAARQAEKRLKLKIVRDVPQLRDEAARVAERYVDSIRPCVSNAYKEAHVTAQSQAKLFHAA
jgi:hypothetical protein